VTGTFLFSLAFYALLLCNILFLTEVWHYSILKAGFAVTPGPIMAALSAAIAGRFADRYGQRVLAVPGPLVFATGCAIFALSLGSEADYLGHYLPATLLTGIGVGMSFASFSSAAVAELPPTRFATGSAIASCLRQIGAVMGISVLIALLGSGQSLHTFHQAYGLMAIPSAAAGILAIGLGRVHARNPLETAVRPAESA
jgi:MFS family permease